MNKLLENKIVAIISQNQEDTSKYFNQYFKTLKHASILMHHQNLHGYLKVKDYQSLYQGMKQNIDIKEELFELFEIDKNKRIHTLTDSQKKLILFIFTISQKCDYYFFDRPFEGLNYIEIKRWIHAFLSYVPLNASIYIASNQCDLLEKICDSYCFFENKEIIKQGNIDEIREGYHLSLQEYYINEGLKQ